MSRDKIKTEIRTSDAGWGIERLYYNYTMFTVTPLPAVSSTAQMLIIGGVDNRNKENRENLPRESVSEPPSPRGYDRLRTQYFDL